MARERREVSGLMGDTKMLEIKGLGDWLHVRIKKKHVNKCVQTVSTVRGGAGVLRQGAEGKQV